MNEINPATLASYVVWGGLLLGFVFGFIGNRTNFCTMGAVSDIVAMGDWNRMRMWLLAIGVAVLGTAALEFAGLIKVADTIYTAPKLTWLAHLIGGLCFGFGMVLGSGCGSKTLIRVGTGNLKSLVVALVLAVAAYMTMRGLFAPLRANVIEPVSIALGGPQDLPSVIARALALDRKILGALCGLIVGGGLVGFALSKPEARAREYLLGGITVGAVVIAGWYLTGVIGHVAEHPQTLQEAWIATNTAKMESLTFVGPQAFSLELMLLWTDQSRIVTFGIASTIGVVLGSAVYALSTGGFRLESFRDAEDLVNHICAGVLMGFGGVLALGCTVGQGITGFSTLALGSFITFAAIVGGAVIALKYQTWRFERLLTRESAMA